MAYESVYDQVRLLARLENDQDVLDNPTCEALHKRVGSTIDDWLLPDLIDRVEVTGQELIDGYNIVERGWHRISRIYYGAGEFLIQTTTLTDGSLTYVLIGHEIQGSPSLPPDHTFLMVGWKKYRMDADSDPILARHENVLVDGILYEYAKRSRQDPAEIELADSRYRGSLTAAKAPAAIPIQYNRQPRNWRRRVF